MLAFLPNLPGIDRVPQPIEGYQRVIMNGVGGTCSTNDGEKSGLDDSMTCRPKACERKKTTHRQNLNTLIPSRGAARVCQQPLASQESQRRLGSVKSSRSTLQLEP